MAEEAEEIKRLNQLVADLVARHDAQGVTCRALRSERDELRAAIVSWANDHAWAAPGWKAHKTNAVLFEIARKCEEGGA